MVFLYLPENILYQISFYLITGILILELMMCIFDLEINKFIDDILKFSNNRVFSIINWVGFGTIPFMYVLIILLISFNISGYVIQYILYSLNFPLMNIFVGLIICSLISIFLSNHIVSNISLFVQNFQNIVIRAQYGDKPLHEFIGKRGYVLLSPTKLWKFYTICIPGDCISEPTYYIMAKSIDNDPIPTRKEIRIEGKENDHIFLISKI